MGVVRRLKQLYDRAVGGSANDSARLLPSIPSAAGHVAAAALKSGGRMTSLVLELQRDALNPEVRCGDLLRKASVVARKLQVTEFGDWTSCELNGYIGKPIPSYRQVRGLLRAKNPYRGPIPLMMPTAEMTELLSLMPVQQSISELDDLIAGTEKNGTLSFSFPPDMEHDLMRTMEIPLQPVVQISRSTLVGVVDAVRNTVLNWSMTLEERGILGHGMSFTSEERQQAQTTVPTNVTNFYGNVSHSQVAPGAASPVQNVGIPSGASSELKDLLLALTDAVDQLGASKDDRAEVRAEIATIQAQIVSPRPKNKVVVESLHTIRNVLEGAAGSVLASELLPRLIKVLSQL